MAATKRRAKQQLALRDVPLRDQKMLWAAAAGRCSFPKCAKRLVAERSKAEGEVLLGEMAHIVPKSVGGPRGEYAIAEEERNRYRNLLLLCEAHHKIVDAQRATYPPEVLLRFKQEHEERSQEPFNEPLIAPEPLRPWITEEVFSTLLPVIELPRRVYTAEVTIDDEKLVKREFTELMGKRPPPFIIREKRLMSFDDLATVSGVFSRWVRPQTTERIHAVDLWTDPSRFRYYVALLNIILRKLAGTRGLTLSKEDLHWYFPPGEDGTEASRTYQPLNRPSSERKVAWRPQIRATGEKRKYWEHLAVGLQFHRVAPESWVLSLRPERHFTRDGAVPLSSAGSARRSTSRVSRLYNQDVLEDANFWRSYLAEGKPRIIWRFGSQSLIIDAALVASVVTWPGVPDDQLKYANARPADDLFSLADLADALGAESVEYDPAGIVPEGEDEGKDADE